MMLRISIIPKRYQDVYTGEAEPVQNTCRSLL